MISTPVGLAANHFEMAMASVCKHLLHRRRALIAIVPDLATAQWDIR